MMRSVCSVILLFSIAVGCNSNDKANESTATSNASSKQKVGPKSSGGELRFEPIERLNEVVLKNGSENKRYALPETLGSGIALLDYDCDGQYDVVGAGGGKVSIDERTITGLPGAIWRGTGPFSHTNVSEAAHVDLSATYHHGIYGADIDDDGFPDFLVTGIQRLQLFRNQGDGTFESIASHANLTDTMWSVGAAFFDADNDGDLDLYVSHYSNWSFENNPPCQSIFQPQNPGYCSPREYEGLPDSLFENLGDGTFRDVSERVRTEIPSRGLGVIAGDFNNDRRLDLYVANDVQANLFFRNDGGWKFDEIGVQAGVATDDKGNPEGSMGLAVGDYNKDGRFDLIVTNYQDEINALYRNDGNMSFYYATRSMQLVRTDERGVSWGVAFNDLDLDGDEDMVVINGQFDDVPAEFLRQRPQILENMDGKAFLLDRKSDDRFSNTPIVGRGLALCDFDRDGLMDFGVSRIGDTHQLVRNTSHRLGKFISVRAIGRDSNRDAIGTLMKLRIGDRTIVRQIVGGGSYASTSDRTVHFGIPQQLASSGNATLEITWPNGLNQSMNVNEFDRSITAIEGL